MTFLISYTVVGLLSYNSRNYVCGCRQVFEVDIYRVRHLTFFFQLVLISWMATLSSCLIWQTISFILAPNEYGCVHAWTTLGNIATLLFTILAKESSDLGGYVNNQNCRIWGTENPHAYIEKPTHPKRITVWCGF